MLSVVLQCMVCSFAYSPFFVEIKSYALLEAERITPNIKMLVHRLTCVKQGVKGPCEVEIHRCVSLDHDRWIAQFLL